MNDAEWKEWLHQHSRQVLEHAGVGQGKAVLDFGCGSGVYTLAAAKMVGESQVYALDMDVRELHKVERAASEQGLTNIGIILSSDLETGLPDGSVQVALMHDMLHMVDEWGTLFKAVYKGSARAAGSRSIRCTWTRTRWSG